MRASRMIRYFHLPVPLSAVGEDFFRPLGDLTTPKETNIFLGLVHQSDGVDGGLRRLGMARKFRREFGIATECGISRSRSRAIVKQLVELHATILEAETPQFER